MNLTGEKVILRAMEEQDQDMLLNLIQDPYTVKTTGGYPCPASYEHQTDWFGSLSDPAGSVRRVIAGKTCPQEGLGIFVLSNLDPKGKTGEIYIKLLQSARQKGYGEDAVNTFVSYGFGTLRLSHIYAHILEHNTASRKLFEKCGFELEAVCESRLHNKDNGRKVCVYGIQAVAVFANREKV